MKSGAFEGQGTYTMPNSRLLQGNFHNGEILDLEPECLAALERHVLFTEDPENSYVNDNGSTELFYNIMVPQNPIGTLVLLPGTWEPVGHALSGTKRLCQLAYQHHLAVMCISVNQRLVLGGRALEIINAALSHAVRTYRLPKDKMVLGGFSMGGLFSMRYAQLTEMDSSLTVLKPRGVINVDGPIDLLHLYHNFEKKYNGNPESEPGYGMRDMRKSLGGTPDTAKDAYIANSVMSVAATDAGNAKYLLTTPLRIYTDADVNWWMENRGVNAYDMNVLDQSALVLWLNKNGNKRAELINAVGKGYRIDGARHPHSWSIVDAEQVMPWILRCLE